MPTTFADSNGTNWTLCDLDAFLIRDIRESAKVDLADVAGESFATLERDPAALVDVLCALCSPQDKKVFAKAIRGQALENALTAVRGAVENFFPPKKWSDLQSNLSRRKEADETFASLKPMLDMLNRPDMPTAMREVVLSAIKDQIEASTGSQFSEADPSASGPDVSPANAAAVSLDSLAKAPAA